MSDEHSNYMCRAGGEVGHEEIFCWGQSNRIKCVGRRKGVHATVVKLSRRVIDAGWMIYCQYGSFVHRTVSTRYGDGTVY